MAKAELDDVLAITALVHRYPELIDTGDFDGIAGLFQHATVRSGANSFAGRAELLQLWKGWVRLYEDGTPRTKHVVTNLVVEVDGPVAQARSYVTVLQAVPPDFPLQVIVSARHHDRFERVDGSWRFSERVDFTDLVGDLSRHTTAPYSSEDAPGDAPGDPSDSGPSDSGHGGPA